MAPCDTIEYSLPEILYSPVPKITSPLYDSPNASIPKAKTAAPLEEATVAFPVSRILPPIALIASCSELTRIVSPLMVILPMTKPVLVVLPAWMQGLSASSVLTFKSPLMVMSLMAYKAPTEVRLPLCNVISPPPDTIPYCPPFNLMVPSSVTLPAYNSPKKSIANAYIAAPFSE